MKYFYAILLIILGISSSYAQKEKVYITDKGQLSNDPQNATSYIVIFKINDSTYKVKQYHMNDTIMLVGEYKDLQLSIPNGRFTFYNKLTANQKANNPNLKSINTNNYIQQVGCFINGKKTGTWYEYASNGDELSESNYVDGKKNGLYKVYFDNQWSEVNIVDNLYEGKYSTYNADSLLIQDIDYVHNNIVQKNLHLVSPIPPDNFDEALEKKLKKYSAQLRKNSMYAKFTIDTKGHILNPQLLESISPEIDSAMVKALVSSPSFTPAKYDIHPINQTIALTIIIFHEDENYALSEQRAKANEIKNRPIGYSGPEITVKFEPAWHP
jgi:antitoxin component YwqK of YwqJK toxin-antitoxin module